MDEDKLRDIIKRELESFDNERDPVLPAVDSIMNAVEDYVRQEVAEAVHSNILDLEERA